MTLNIDFEDRNVVVIGLGYVGLTLGAYLAEIGFNVHGVEIRELVLKSLQSRKSFFWEPKLDELIGRNIEQGSFTFSDKIPEANARRVFIITVGTPIDNNKKAILESIVNVSEQVASSMNDGDMVILRSTVKLNTTNSVVAPILNKSGKDFDLAFCPERTLEGAALSELGSLPQIVGAASRRARLRAANFFQQVTPSVVNVSNIETAEMIKLVDNMQRDVFFAVSNEVAHLCNSQPIKASEVISAGKLGYKRTNLATPGPVGGPCLEKDSYLLAESVHEHGSVARIAMAARVTNENVVGEAAHFISAWVNENVNSESAKVVLLGMAFKGIPETNDLRGTPTIPLIESLRREIPNGEFFCWDPIISHEDLEALGFQSDTSLQRILKDASAIVLVNNHPDLGALDLGVISNSATGPLLIYDFWGRNDQTLSLGEYGHYYSWGNHFRVSTGLGESE